MLYGYTIYWLYDAHNQALIKLYKVTSRYLNYLTMHYLQIALEVIIPSVR